MQPVIELAGYRFLILNHVPFVNRQDQGPAFLNDHAGDGQVLFFQHRVTVQHQHHDLGKTDGAQRFADRKPLDFLGNPGLAPHAGGIDQLDLAPPIGPGDGNGIPGNARFRAGQHAVIAEQLVDQGGLADIGTADDGQLQGAGRIVFLITGGRMLFRRFFNGIGRQRVIQIAHAFPMLGGNGQWLAQA